MSAVATAEPDAGASAVCRGGGGSGSGSAGGLRRDPRAHGRRRPHRQGSQIALPAPNGILRIMFPTDEAPGYWVVMGNWDGQWYQQIATHGYPTALPPTTAPST